jgi:hypothetical protein
MVPQKYGKGGRELGWMKIKKLQKYSDSKIGKRGGENE